MPFIWSTLFPSFDSCHHFCTTWPIVTYVIKNGQWLSTLPFLTFDLNDLGDLTLWINIYIFLRMVHYWTECLQKVWVSSSTGLSQGHAFHIFQKTKQTKLCLLNCWIFLSCHLIFWCTITEGIWVVLVAVIHVIWVKATGFKFSEEWLSGIFWTVEENQP